MGLCSFKIQVAAESFLRVKQDEWSIWKLSLESALAILKEK